MRALLQVAGFVAAILAFFAWAGFAVTDAIGERDGGSAMPGDVGPEAGRRLFFGAGRCSTCHAFGSEGSAIRCPDLGGGSAQGAAIGVRAAGRVPGEDALRYLFRSLYEPDAFVVQGYPAGLMKPVHLPPTSLSDAEITSVVLFLLDASGAAAPEAGLVARSQRPFLGRAASEASSAEVGLDLPAGDPIAGRDAFVLAGKCWSCHQVEGLAIPGDVEARPDALVGPDLSSIGAIQTRAYLLDSLTSPDLVIVADPAGVLPGSDASYRSPGGASRMPGFLDALSFQQVLDIVAFLETLDGSPEGDE